MSSQRRVSIVLFDGFELLDAFGPIELLSRLPDEFALTLVGPAAEPILSRQGTRTVADVSYTEAEAPDIVLVPGGQGTRSLVGDEGFLRWLRDWAGDARLVTSVCTGSALLAASGLLDGFRATSNKRAFAWATQFGSDVTWVPQARWVADRTRWTSSGIAAGMDMTHALIADIVGPDAAAEVAESIEYSPHTNPDDDPFARANGLV